MNPKPTQAALIESALAAIEQLLERIHGDVKVPFHGPTELASLPADTQKILQLADEKIYREQPEQSALHFCLVSASALLDVSQALMDSKAKLSPHEREREWKALATCTKIAGRSAYRAALILADPPPLQPAGIAAR